MAGAKTTKKTTKKKSKKVVPKKTAKKVSAKTTKKVAKKKVSKKEQTIEEKYQKLSQREHILVRPDSYVGSLEPCTEKMWVFDAIKKLMVERIITYSPGLYKIFDELLVNIADHSKLHASCNAFTIDIDVDAGTIIVKNNGPGIPVVIHKEHEIYVPNLIFGHLLTGTNFDDEEERTTGGRNGYGAKLTNIFSNEFIVETVDSENQLKFKQVFSDNMSTVGKPKVTSCKKSSYTQITSTPDLEKFGLDHITPDIFDLFVKRAYDLAGVCPGTSVTINGEKIKFKSFKQYTEMFELIPESEGEVAATEFSKMIYHEEERWQVGMIFAPDQSFKQISYVNSINTFHGGKHVEHVLDQICTYVKAQIYKKDKKMTVKDQTIKDNLLLFINATIINPEFDSQTKERLKTKKSVFKDDCTLPVKSLKALVTAGLVEQIMSSIQKKDQTKLGKKAKKGTKSLSDLIKLDDAPKAGTTQSHLCTLFLTEGDSAKTLAVAGASELDKNYVGIFPLKGKPMNVREHSMSAVMKNEEIIAICRILGLEPGVKYTQLKQLRYGKLVMMADQDVDGFHIKGLILNAFHYLWPELLEDPEFGDFFNSFRTPVMKATKGKQCISFYNVPEFDEWKKTAKSGWFIKYYKGLGTSTKTEAKEYFKDLANLVTPMKSIEIENLLAINKTDQAKMKIVVKPPKKKKKKKVDDEDESEELDDDNCGGIYVVNVKYKNPNTEAITLAFEKVRANDRKGWVKDDSTDVLNYTDGYVTIPDFLNKEMRLYSRDDCERNIPGIDGMKPGGRKIVQTMKKKGILNIKKQQKVGQIANLSSAEMDYHHGEKSMCESIVKQAQNHCGSNNVSIFEPEGQFGSRVQNGADHASERYTFSYMNALGQILIRSDDDDVLEYNVDDDDKQIEAKLFAPILPLVLMNGAAGIGTGFSTSIPMYNPKDILAIFRAFLNEEEADYDILPFMYGFKGSILKSNDEGTYLVYGKYQIVDESTVRITEIPVGSTTCKSFEKYKIFLSKLKESGKIIDFVSKVDDTNCEFIVTMDDAELTAKRKKKEVYKFFALVAKINTSNMNLHDVNGTLKYYNTINEILDEYYYFRLDIYAKRKVHLIGKLKKELDILTWKMKFIDDYINGVLEINNKKKADIIAQLVEAGFPKILPSKKESIEDDDEDINTTKAKSVGNYNYLLSIKLYALTEEQIAILRAQLDAKTEELQVVETTSEEEQWLYELDEFEVEYDRVKVLLDETNAITTDVETVAPVKTITKKKKAVRKK